MATRTPGRGDFGLLTGNGLNPRALREGREYPALFYFILFFVDTVSARAREGNGRMAREERGRGENHKRRGVEQPYTIHCTKLVTGELSLSGFAQA